MFGGPTNARVCPNEVYNDGYCTTGTDLDDYGLGYPYYGHGFRRGFDHHGFGHVAHFGGGDFGHGLGHMGGGFQASFGGGHH
jgi:hypothetical protein